MSSLAAVMFSGKFTLQILKNQLRFANKENQVKKSRNDLYQDRKNCLEKRSDDVHVWQVKPRLVKRNIL